ncbi:MAG: hypothetical protein JNK40_00880 [Chromatiales bacterium]|nr:hypothetical protein [Chromatiales bacterium]
MKQLLAMAAVVLLALPFQLQAATPRTDADCAQLLERWASDPKAAPKSEINACKDQLAAIAPAAGPAPEPVAAVDPCAGPNAASSVLCWGPWSALAPAAAGPLASLDFPETFIECDAVAELANQCVPQLVLVPPVEQCQPGTPCGFATIVAGVTSTGEAADTEFGRISLAADGTSFVINPESGGEIASVPMTTNIQPRTDGYDGLRATGREGEVNSRLIARIVQDDGDGIQLAADVWTHGTRESARSGYFAWGTATSQAGLDALNAGNVTLNFSGPMSVNNATTGNMTLNFGSSPNWTGSWTNPAWSFGAGGTVSGPNLISLPGQFTDNVTGSGNFVQGAIVGEQGGPRGITHIIDVTLEGQGRIKDVGLLRDVIAGPVIGP